MKKTDSKIKRSAGSIFHRNMLLVSMFVLILTALSLIVYITLNNTMMNSQIKLMEQREIERTATAVNLSVDQIAVAGMYFSSIDILNYSQSFSVENYYQDRITEKSVDSVLAVLDAVKAVSIMNGGKTFGNDISPGLRSFKGESFGTVRGMSVYITENGAGHSLLFKTEDDEEGYRRNTVYMSVDINVLSGYVFEKNSDNRTCFVVNSGGDVVLSQQNHNVGTDINGIYGFTVFDEKTGNQGKRLKGYEVSVRKIDFLDWYAVSVTKSEQYASNIRQNQINTFLLCLMLLTVGLVSSYAIFRITYRPIRDIISMVNKYGIPELSEANEVEMVGKRLSELSFAKSELEQEIKEKVTAIRQHQVIAMQSQITPHFVNNSLDVLNWIAYRNLKTRNNEISVAVRKISEFLQFVLNKRDMFCTIREEIEITGVYIDIINVYFKDAYQTNWDVEDTILDCDILKMCIQPLVENAATHAFNNSCDDPQINIVIKESNGNISVSVKDNGCGISQEQLLKLRDSVNDFSAISVKHIGMKNVNQRLKFLYGAEYGLYIESEEGKGTVCGFTIPKQL